MDGPDSELRVQRSAFTHLHDAQRIQISDFKFQNSDFYHGICFGNPRYMQILHVKTYRRKPTKSRILLLWGSMQIADCKMLHLSEFCVCEFCSADCKSVWPAQNSRILLWVCAEQKFRELTFCCPRIKMQKGKFNTTLADSPHHCGESPMTLTEFCCHVEAVWHLEFCKAEFKR